MKIRTIFFLPVLNLNQKILLLKKKKMLNEKVSVYALVGPIFQMLSNNLEMFSHFLRKKKRFPFASPAILKKNSRAKKKNESQL